MINPKTRGVNQNIYDFLITNYGNLSSIQEFLDDNGFESMQDFDDVPVGATLIVNADTNKVNKTYKDDDYVVSTSERVVTYNDVLMEEYLANTVNYFAESANKRGQRFKITNSGDATKIKIYVDPTNAYSDFNLNIYEGDNGSNGALLAATTGGTPIAGLMEISLPNITLNTGTDYSLIYWRSSFGTTNIRYDLLANSTYPLPYMFFRDDSPNVLLTGGAIQFQIYSQTETIKYI